VKKQKQKGKKQKISKKKKFQIFKPGALFQTDPGPVRSNQTRPDPPGSIRYFFFNFNFKFHSPSNQNSINIHPIPLIFLHPFSQLSLILSNSISTLSHFLYLLFKKNIVVNLIPSTNLQTKLRRYRNYKVRHLTQDFSARFKGYVYFMLY